MRAETSTAPRRGWTDDLSGLTIIDLAVLYEAYRAASATLLAFINQPRCSQEAEDFLDIEVLSRRADAVAREMMQRTPASSRERAEFARIVIDWRMGNSPETERAAFSLAQQLAST